MSAADAPPADVPPAGAPPADEVEAGPAVRRVVDGSAGMGTVPHRFKRMVSLEVPRAHVLEVLQVARREGFDLLSDVLGMDWLTYPRHRGPRFSVIYNLYSIAANERLFLRVDLEDGERLPTCTGIWPAANFQEREVYDMFGVEFDGHPDLRKLLTPEDLEGHPHRKDFPIGETPTLFGDGRFLDPPAFRAGLIGASRGLTGWIGGARKGVVSEQTRPRDTADNEGETAL